MTSNRARRAYNTLDLRSIASTFASVCDSRPRPGHARAVNLTQTRDDRAPSRPQSPTCSSKASYRKLNSSLIPRSCRDHWETPLRVDRQKASFSDTNSAYPNRRTHYTRSRLSLLFPKRRTRPTRVLESREAGTRTIGIANGARIMSASCT